ncbi:FadR/GntR family transcriptional regulator [Streptomyces flavidovirens]|uniref:FadR/GntR family transcriptional regulator n=1 Tax=Streptomyces flavidovirens TaxID=67298 RepID=UPI0009989E95|nr:winged helix-turn-helix domain-containing protein [Streptomyces flavidovirens]
MSEATPCGTYLVVSEKLRELIGGDESADVLPSEADLMREYGVGRNTIRRALKVLEAEGVLESAPGIGWRIVRGGDRRSLAEQMSDLIAEESLSVGDPYPSEAKLCERFSTPVGSQRLQGRAKRPLSAVVQTGRQTGGSGYVQAPSSWIQHGHGLRD